MTTLTASPKLSIGAFPQSSAGSHRCDDSSRHRGDCDRSDRDCSDAIVYETKPLPKLHHCQLLLVYGQLRPCRRQPSAGAAGASPWSRFETSTESKPIYKMFSQFIKP